MKRKSMADQPTAITLTNEEKSLFEFLLDVNEQNKCNLTLRVAGGWVRDKLLGRSSDDIDIALDNMTGAAFADLVNAYETQHGHKTHAVGIIKANPDQSKHLETATMQLGTGWVDFVNLRAETYADDEAHRIPSMEFGTPLEDAQRRDFTINSLFYNLATESVEDFTGQGLSDLRNGLIRTPLDPNVTFLDDPLRVLRAIRFASRFQFPLADNLTSALENQNVRDALQKKVSRERVEKELTGMLTGTSAHPFEALELLHQFNLDQCVFELPKGPYYINQSAGPTNFTDWELSQVCLKELRAWTKQSTSTEQELHQFKLLLLAGTLLPVASWTTLQKKKHIPVAYSIIRESIKFAAKDADHVGLVLLQQFRRFVEIDQFNRVQIGLLLRDVGNLWPLCAEIAYVYEVIFLHRSKASVQEKYNALGQFISDVHLDSVWEMQPLLNGKELMDALGLKPGPAVKPIKDAVIAFQLEHPEATREECLEHIRSLQ